MLPGTQYPMGPPPITPGEVGATPSRSGDIPAGRLGEGVLPVIGAGPAPGAAPNVPGAVPIALPTLGIATVGGVPLSGAAPIPGAAPNVPIDPYGAAVCAKLAGATAINAAAIANEMDFPLSMRGSFEVTKARHMQTDLLLSQANYERPMFHYPCNAASRRCRKRRTAPSGSRPIARRYALCAARRSPARESRSARAAQ
jgi:hypothetical protein